MAINIFKIEKDCGISIKKLGWATCAAEVIFSLVIVTLTVYCWMVKDAPSIFIYYPKPTDTEEIRHRSLEGCIVSWSFTILLCLCLWRIVSSAILLFAVKKSSAILIQYWIAYKILILIISTFIGVVSFTSPILAPSALLSFTVDFLTCYFIVNIYPEIENIAKGHSLLLHKPKSIQDTLQLHT